ncbi:hypothetical protein B0O99DRAFT_600687 [Bisporella sp. PMI_857]|nr:hypothetical protein B0O99DRAFT_600687 [Bisporella sp. PMI_857]
MPGRQCVTVCTLCKVTVILPCDTPHIRFSFLASIMPSGELSAAFLRSSRANPQSQAEQIPANHPLDSESRPKRHLCSQTISTDLPLGEALKDPLASSLSTGPLRPECTSRQQQPSGSLHSHLPTRGARAGEPAAAGTKRIINDSIEEISDSNVPLSPGCYPPHREPDQGLRTGLIGHSDHTFTLHYTKKFNSGNPVSQTREHEAPSKNSPITKRPSRVLPLESPFQGPPSSEDNSAIPTFRPLSAPLSPCLIPSALIEGGSQALGLSMAIH